MLFSKKDEKEQNEIEKSKKSATWKLIKRTKVAVVCIYYEVEVCNHKNFSSVFEYVAN